MRKLSELYSLVLDEAIRDEGEYGICTEIGYVGMEDDEEIHCRDHFKNGDHKLPKSKRIENDFWFSDGEERIEYLKYLIQLCKDQSI